jgi:hypothetical protein
VWSPQYKSVVLADGPVIYWRLDETLGTVAADSSGSGHDGTYGAPTVLGQPGALVRDANLAVSIAGRGWIASSWPYPVGGRLSIEGWAKGPAAASLLVASTTNGQVPNLWFDDPSHLVWYPRNTSGVSFPIAGKWSATNWNYFVLTWDDVTQAAHLYLNGIEVTGGVWAHGAAVSFGTPYNFEAGAVAAGGGAWAGPMDEIAVYPYILTAAQVAAHYQAA